MGQGEAPLVDPGAVHDPFGIEAVGILEVEIADHVVGDVAPRTQDLETRQRARSRDDVDLAVAHGHDPAVLRRDLANPYRAIQFGHSALSSLGFGTLASSTANRQEAEAVAGIERPARGLVTLATQ